MRRASRSHRLADPRGASLPDRRRAWCEVNMRTRVHVKTFSEKLDQQRALSVSRDRIDGVLYRAGRFGADQACKTTGFRRYLIASASTSGRHRRAEEERLPIGQDLRHNPIQLRRESHVEHAIRLIENPEPPRSSKGDVLALHVVERRNGVATTTSTPPSSAFDWGSLKLRRRSGTTRRSV